MSEHTASPGPGGRLNPAALTVADVARLLAAAGRMQVDEAAIRADIEAGAPTNDDGTIHLTHYTAWLIKRMGELNRGD